VAIGAQIVTNLQHIASRTVDPIASAVVSVTRFVADNQPNVIPSTVELGGTTRAFDADVRADVLRRLEQIATGVATSHGAIAEVTIEEGYPVLVNDGPLTEVVRAVLAAGLPDVALVDQHQEMGVDDFAVLASQVPGCFFNVGAGDPTWESSAPHHHPSFHIDERALPIGVEALTVVALGLL
jgi:amidohydrolase